MKTPQVPVLTALAGIALLVAGCDGSQASESRSPEATAGDGKTVIVPLQAQNGSGQSGTATLTAKGPRTRIVLRLESAPDAPQPAHVHRGTCGGDLDPEPAYALENVAGGSSDTVVDVPLEELESGRFAVDVHESEPEEEVACGTIGPAAREEEKDTGGPDYGY
ncbi:MAG TPA: hypothetical protein VHK22_01125 [Gaiellaceae bacterium]|nr:hypothetical protein [Gaiellaceae bacterium]